MASSTSLNTISCLKLLNQISLTKSFQTRSFLGSNFSTQTLKLSPTHLPFSTTRPSKNLTTTASENAKRINFSKKSQGRSQDLGSGAQKLEIVPFSNIIYTRDQKKGLGITAGVCVPEKNGHRYDTIVFHFGHYGHVSLQGPCLNHDQKTSLIVTGGSGTFEGVEGKVKLQQSDELPSKLFYEFDLKGIRDLPVELMDGVLVKF